MKNNLEETLKWLRICFGVNVVRNAIQIVGKEKAEEFICKHYEFLSIL